MRTAPVLFTRLAISVILCVTGSGLLGGCARIESIVVACVDDDSCPEGERCRGGVCVDPTGDTTLGGLDGSTRPVDDTTPAIPDVDEPDDVVDPPDASSPDTTVDTGLAADVGTAGDGWPGDPCGSGSDCVHGLCSPSDGPQAGHCLLPCTDTCLDPDTRCTALPDGRRACTLIRGDLCEGGAICVPGASQAQSLSCGTCADGSRSRTRSCADTCTWGAWGTYGTCGGDPTCAPGSVESRSRPCGDCGGTQSEQRACNPATCDWNAWTSVGACVDGGTRTCSAGDTDAESRPCGACGRGTQQRTRTCGADGCTWGPFGNWEACSEPEPTGESCVAGDTQSDTEPCGPCNTGTRTRTRSCNATSCNYDAWTEWSACDGPAPACSPGQVDRQTQGCGNCGSQTRERTCSATTCGWNDWGGWSGCGGQGECSPGSRRAGCDSCGENVCAASCTWGTECVLRAGSSCFHNAGRNWRCCGASSWQFCLPPNGAGQCHWSTACAACSGCGC